MHCLTLVEEWQKRAYIAGDKGVVGVHYLSVQDSDFSIIKLLAQIHNYEIIVGTSYGDVSSKYVFFFCF